MDHPPSILYPPVQALNLALMSQADPHSNYALTLHPTFTFSFTQPHNSIYNTHASSQLFSEPRVDRNLLLTASTDP